MSYFVVEIFCVPGRLYVSYLTMHFRVASLALACLHDCPIVSLQWRHTGRDIVSNHQPHDCLLNGLFRHRWKKTSKPRITGFVWGIHRWSVNSPHKGPVTRKRFPFDDVIMKRKKHKPCVYYFGSTVQQGCMHLATQQRVHKTHFRGSLYSGSMHWCYSI